LSDMAVYGVIAVCNRSTYNKEEIEIRRVSSSPIMNPTVDIHRSQENNDRMIASITATSAAMTYVAALCYLSFIRSGRLGMLYRAFGIRNDNVFHILCFILLAFLLRLMFSTRLYRPAIQSPRIWSVSVAIGISLSIELIQLFTPTRHGTSLDFFLHAAGIAIFFIIDKATQNT
jgi:glycopeptide antibiotics resistance protein